MVDLMPMSNYSSSFSSFVPKLVVVDELVVCKDNFGACYYQNGSHSVAKCQLGMQINSNAEHQL